MIDDPSVNEVRKTRQRNFAECDEQLDRLIERLKAADSRDKKRLVTPEDVKKRPQLRTTPSQRSVTAEWDCVIRGGRR